MHGTILKARPGNVPRRGLLSWALLFASMLVIPQASLLAMLGAVGLFAELLVTLLGRIVLRDEPTAWSCSPLVHALFRGAHWVADSILGPGLNLWGRSLAAIRFDWPGLSARVCVLTAVFCGVSFAYLRVRFRRCGFRNDSVLRWREEIALQCGLWPAALTACAVVLPATAFAVSVWLLLPYPAAGLVHQTSYQSAVFSALSPDNCVAFVSTGAAALALVLAACRVPRLVDAMVSERLRATGPLCRRCGYPLRGCAGKCSECGRDAAASRSRSGRRGRRRMWRVPRRAARWMWALAAVGVCSLFIGGPGILSDLGFLLRGRLPPARASAAMTVYLRFDETYILTLGGQHVLLRADALRFGGASIAAAWRDDASGGVRAEDVTISEIDRQLPVMLVAPPVIDLPAGRAFFSSPMFFDGRQRYENRVLLRMFDCPARTSIRLLRGMDESERQSFADLERTLWRE